ncbi:hypothetical protein [Peribacillus muralis]|uniref:hypothetical protein n=1 Tax=Peribacillus muralis TaxID=264697 RepID=UPI003CFD7235
MAKVKFNNEFGGGCFTENEIYDTQDTCDGLMVVDDNGEGHIIATDKNEDKSYDGDSFFRNNFDYI